MFFTLNRINMTVLSLNLYIFTQPIQINSKKQSIMNRDHMRKFTKIGIISMLCIFMGFNGIFLGQRTPFLEFTENWVLFSAGVSAPFEILDQTDLELFSSSGNGNTTNPYLIQDYIINASGSADCIYVESIDYYCIIQNCTFIQGWAGIYLYNTSNIILRNNSFIACENGVEASLTINITIFDNNINNCEDSGIKLTNCEQLNISSNFVENSLKNGISFINSNNIVINANEIVGSGISALDLTGMNFTLTNNNFSSCGLRVSSLLLENLQSYNIDLSNLVNNKPLFYILNQTEMSISDNAGQIFLVNCTDVSVQNMGIQNCTIGISVMYSTNISITNVSSSFHSLYGILIWNSTDCHVLNTSTSFNQYYGILGVQGYNISFISNAITENLKTGLNLQNSAFQHILDSEITSNIENGVKLDGCMNCTLDSNEIHENLEHSIFLDGSNGTHILRNSFYENLNGIILNSSSNNFIQKNAISNCVLTYIGMDSLSDNNSVLQNDFLSLTNSTLQFYDAGRNNWSDSSNSLNLGNYFSDFLHQYPSTSFNSTYITNYTITGPANTSAAYSSVNQWTNPPPIVSFTLDWNNATNSTHITWTNIPKIIAYFVYRTINDQNLTRDITFLLTETHNLEYTDNIGVLDGTDQIKYSIIALNASGYSHILENIIHSDILFPSDSTDTTTNDSTDDSTDDATDDGSIDTDTQTSSDPSDDDSSNDDPFGYLTDFQVLLPYIAIIVVLLIVIISLAKYIENFKESKGPGGLIGTYQNKVNQDPQPTTDVKNSKKNKRNKKKTSKSSDFTF
ncbi:MAG: NosD domain-containing protein [Promethearchaeota archaeon]